MVHMLELERLIWPVLSLITTFLSGLLFVIAMATPAWFQIDIHLSGQEIGNITAGLIQGSQIIEGETGLLVDSTFYTFERFSDVISLTSLYILLTCLILTIPVSLGNMAFEFVNTYQVVKEWWRGPATMYVISLLVVVLAGLSVAVFADFYTVDLSDKFIKQKIINSSRTDINLERYTGTASMHYSAYIFFVGAVMCVLPLLFSWRLTILLPVLYTTDILAKHKYIVPNKMEMEELDGEELDEEEEEDDDDDDEEEEEEEEEEGQFFMTKKASVAGSDEESGSTGGSNEDDDEEDESEDEDELELDSYRYPTDQKVAAAGYVTYQ